MKTHGNARHHPKSKSQRKHFYPEIVEIEPFTDLCS
ncbi:Uncharacterised protein [Vibrio cholerae]|nr:Uncharacterised protein [Vibrio cholerae]